MTTESDVRDRLQALRRSVVVPPASSAAIVGVARRRRRRRIGGGVAAGALLVAGGAVFAALADDDSASDLDTVATTTTMIAEPSSTTTQPASTASIGEPLEVASFEGDVEMVAAGLRPTSLSSGASTFLVPWDGGFLLFGSEETPVPLPPLDGELAAAFPAEMLDIIESSGATTVQDALAALRLAGMAAEATELVLDNPDLLGDLFSGPGVPFIRWSADGAVWEERDVDALPTTDPIEVVSDGQRLVMAAGGADGANTVYVTDDLESWRSYEIPLLTTPTSVSWLQASGTNIVTDLSIDDDGWVLTTQDLVTFDVEGLFSADEVRALVDVPGDVDVEFESADGEALNFVVGPDASEVVVPWSETGVTYDEVVRESAPKFGWAGDWTATAVEELTLPEARCCSVRATDAGRVAVDPVTGAQYWIEAPDGSWTPANAPPGVLVAIHAVDERHLAFVLEDPETWPLASVWELARPGGPWRQVDFGPEAVGRPAFAVGSAIRPIVVIPLDEASFSPGFGFTLRSSEARSLLIATVDDAGQWHSLRVDLGENELPNGLVPTRSGDRLLIPAGDVWRVVDLSS